MKINLINLQEVKDIVNGYLFKLDGFGFKELKVNNETIDILGGKLNEIIVSINNS